MSKKWQKTWNDPVQYQSKVEKKKGDFLGTRLKIGHFSDIHADYSSKRKKTPEDVNLREQDGYNAFCEAVDDAIDQEIDVALICGDLFHTHKPSIRSIYEVQQQLRKMSLAGIKIYILAGNHDVSDIRSDVAASKIVDDPYRNIFSHAEPYVHYEVDDGVHIHMVSHHMYEKQLETMKSIKPIDGEINIFATHGSVIDPFLLEALHTEQSPREVVIPDFLLNDFNWDYIMLGHIHERGWVGTKDKTKDTENRRIYYNGSLIRRGFSDKDSPLGKGWTLWTIDDDGSFSADLRKVRQRPQEDFESIDATELSAAQITDRIIKNLRETQTDDIDLFSMPILRQTISGITPAKYSALDLASINKESQHAFSFDIKKVSAKLSSKGTKDSNKKEESINLDGVSQNSDIVKVYDEWKKDSKQLHSATKDFQKRIDKKSRNFISVSQEESLNEE